MASFIATLRHGVETFMDWLSVVMFAIIFIVSLAQILMRWVFNSPLIWSEELVRLMFVWVCYLGWVLATRNGSHIRITTIINRLPPPAKKIIETINSLLVIVFSLLMCYWGVKMAEVGARGRAVTFALQFSWVYGIVPVCNFMIILYTILSIPAIWGKKEGPLHE